MNGAKAFFDTNVLLYMYGGDAGKQARAKELFRQYARAGGYRRSVGFSAHHP